MKVPSATARSKMVSTAIGRRCQLFSPSPDTNGSASKMSSTIAGPISKHRSFQRRRQQRQHGIEPQEKEIRTRRGLDDRRVGRAARTERAENGSARGNRQQNEAGEEDVLPHGSRHERHSLLMGQLVILLQIGCAAHDASGHRPFVDAELQHQEHVHGDERDQQAGDDEHMQREETATASRPQ